MVFFTDLDGQADPRACFIAQLLERIGNQAGKHGCSLGTAKHEQAQRIGRRLELCFAYRRDIGPDRVADHVDLVLRGVGDAIDVGESG